MILWEAAKCMLFCSAIFAILMSKRVFEIEDIPRKVHMTYLHSLNSPKSQVLELACSFVAGRAFDSKFLSLIRQM